jgi:hypothetical protein
MHCAARGVMPPRLDSATRSWNRQARVPRDLTPSFGDQVKKFPTTKQYKACIHRFCGMCNADTRNDSDGTNIVTVAQNPDEPLLNC